jgi:hypothetical protein
MKKKLTLAIAGVLLLFIVTNPSVSAFKTYLGYSSYQGLKRPVNLFVLSEYTAHGDKYVGIVGNFWKVEKPKERTVAVTDSTVLVDSSVKTVDTVPQLPKGYTKIK